MLRKYVDAVVREETHIHSTLYHTDLLHVEGAIGRHADYL
jgi:hypothetical protein